MATIPQRSCDPWAIQVIDTQTFRHPTPNNVVAITRVFLVDPASAAGQGDVCACIKIGTLRYMLASLSAERPCTELLDPFVLDQDFTLYVPGGDDRSDEFIFIIQVEGYQYDRQECDEDQAKEDEDSSEEEEGEEENEDSSDEEEKVDETTSEDDDDSDKEGGVQEEDEDNGEEEEEEEEDEDISDAEDNDYSTEEEEEEEEEECHGVVNRHAALACRYGYDAMLQQSNFVPGGQFVGGPAPRFASYGSTAGFMRVDAAIDSQEEGVNSNKQISVLYRCTHFLRPSGGGLRVRQSTAVYQLRFVVPPTGGMARSLLCVSASLALMLYPVRFHKRLQRLWSSLIAEVSVPTRAWHVEVLVDFGILRTADRTPKRMDRMRAALEGVAQKDFDPEIHLELQLPQPAQCGAGEDCAVCWELLEGDDLAAWPGCSKPHVFHGTCLELVLKRNDNRCPICRSFWSIETKPLNIRNEKDESGDNQVDG